MITWYTIVSSYHYTHLAQTVKVLTMHCEILHCSETANVVKEALHSLGQILCWCWPFFPFTYKIPVMRFEKDEDEHADLGKGTEQKGKYKITS